MQTVSREPLKNWNSSSYKTSSLPKPAVMQTSSFPLLRHWKRKAHLPAQNVAFNVSTRHCLNLEKAVRTGRSRKRSPIAWEQVGTTSIHRRSWTSLLPCRRYTLVSHSIGSLDISHSSG